MVNTQFWVVLGGQTFLRVFFLGPLEAKNLSILVTHFLWCVLVEVHLLCGNLASRSASAYEALKSKFAYSLFLAVCVTETCDGHPSFAVCG